MPLAPTGRREPVDADAARAAGLHSDAVPECVHGRPAAGRLELTDWDGRIVAQKQVMATSGSGTRGTFDVSMFYTVDRAGNGALIVFEESAKDGSRINLEEIPLRVEP